MQIWYLFLGLERRLFHWGSKAARLRYHKENYLFIYDSTGEFFFSAFLHNGRYFLDTPFYFCSGISGSNAGDDSSVFAVTDYQHENKAELWHCRLGHVNLPDLKRLQTSSLGVHIPPRQQLSFCKTCIFAKLNTKPFQNLGEKPTQP